MSEYPPLQQENPPADYPPPQAPGYPPQQQQGYPLADCPPQQGYPPPTGYAPPQQGYQPPPPGYGYYPPQGPPPAQQQQSTNVNVTVQQQPPAVRPDLLMYHKLLFSFHFPLQQKTVVVKKNRPNHILHCIITFFCPIWIFVWVILCCMYEC